MQDDAKSSKKLKKAVDEIVYYGKIHKNVPYSYDGEENLNANTLVEKILEKWLL